MGKHKNEVHLAGELAKDPLIRLTTTGKKVASLTVMTKYEQWTEFHKVVCWESCADKAAGLSKGSFVKIVGRLRTHSWDDKSSGQKRYLTEIVAFQLVVPADEPPSLTPDAIKGGRAAARAILAPATPNIHGVPITDDDIPF